MKRALVRFASGIAAAAAIFFAFSVRAGNGTSLLAHASSSSAMAAGGDFAGVLAFCRSLSPQEAEYWENAINQWMTPYGVKLADFSELLFVSDDRGKQPVFLFRFVQEGKPEELLNANRSRLTSVGGKPELFTLNNVGRDLQDYALGIVSPGICCAVERDRHGWFPKVNFNGAPASLTELVPQGDFLAFCCGAPRLRQAPFDGIDEFFGTLSRGKGDGEVRAVIRSSDPMKASLLQMSFLAVASMWLQTDVGMTPEEASMFFRKHLSIRQRGGQLEMRCRNLKNALLEIAEIRRRTMAEDAAAETPETGVYGL